MVEVSPGAMERDQGVVPPPPQGGHSDIEAVRERVVAPTPMLGLSELEALLFTGETPLPEGGLTLVIHENDSDVDVVNAEGMVIGELILDPPPPPDDSSDRMFSWYPPASGSMSLHCSEYGLEDLLEGVRVDDRRSEGA